MSMPHHQKQRYHAIAVLLISMTRESFICEGAGLAKSSIRRERVAATLSIQNDLETNIAFRSIYKRSAAACTKLTNRGSYFTAAITVGSENQEFDVVADTGSNAVIVADCLCNGQSCPETQNCFDENRSTSCSVNRSADGRVPVVQMTFGSGQIASMIASDVVAVGSRRVMMTDALLLMVGRALSFNGTFDGILGLGIPLQDDDESKIKHNQTGQDYHVTSFLERDRIERFSMCFVDNGNGTLRLDTPPLQTPLRSVGKNHWGLDFRGISIGADSHEGQAIFCKDLPAGQTTPCGAIPDSGTTLIIGPQEQLRVLYAQLCDAWDRCSTAFTDPTKFPGKKKEEVFLLVLLACSEWMDNSTNNPLAELPPLKFHLRDTNSVQKELTFMGNDYIEVGLEAGSEFLSSRTTHTQESLAEFIERHREYLGTPHLFCIPAMGSGMPMVTQANGPIWILGTPLFYAYQVEYNLQPPSMSFQKADCDPCSAELVEVELEHTGSATLGRSVAKSPRQIRGHARWPTSPFVGPL
jgi:hypothetical protein